MFCSLISNNSIQQFSNLSTPSKNLDPQLIDAFEENLD